LENEVEVVPEIVPPPGVKNILEDYDFDDIQIGDNPEEMMAN